MKQWRFAVSSAPEAPATAPILLQGTVEENLEKAAALGYNAIEVHTREDVPYDYGALRAACQRTGVRVAMVIPGRLNTEGMCSLTADEPYITAAAMEGMRRYIDMAHQLQADIVLGWIRGSVPKGGIREKYMDRLARNLRVLASYGAERDVKLHLEVINRYETNIFNTAAETVDFLRQYELQNCYVHLDTFHMGIEETDPLEAIRLCGSRLGYFHLADSTRLYPGTGRFDFQAILTALEQIGYEGYLSVECLPRPSGEEAARRAIAYMKGLCRNI